MKFATPICRFTWPKLQVPDCYREPGQEPNPDTDKYYYSTKVVLNPEDEEVALFLRKLDEGAREMADARAIATVTKGKAKFVEGLYSKNEEVDDQGNETGNIILSFRAMSHGVKNGRAWERAIHLVDHENKPFDAGDKTLGSGTMGKVSFELRAYTSSGKIGVSLQLRAAKIVAPVFYAAPTSNDFADDEVSAEDFAKIQETHGDGGDF